MRSDERAGGSRLLPRPVVPPGPLRELKDALYGLYLDACPVTLDQIRARIEELADDIGAVDEVPGRDSIREVLSGHTVPARVTTVMAVAAALLYRRHTTTELQAAQVRDHPELTRIRRLWQQAVLAVPLGRPIAECTPRDLEVHAAGADTNDLPPYIQRAHDQVLHDAVRAAVAGRSGMVILTSESTAGKTRACYEALHWTPPEPQAQSLAAAGWRIWPARHPGDLDQMLTELPQLGPHTVLWLNEAQRHLLEPGPDRARRIADSLRDLLDDPHRSPVLVLGTLWPTYLATLTGYGDAHASTRLLLEHRSHRVPARFDDAALTAAAASDDPRLVEAARKAESGAVTQYLGGVPDLMRRYTTASTPAQAVVHAAMDARRLGHKEQLPALFLRDAVPAYLDTPDQHRALRRDPSWFATAITELTRLGTANTVLLDPSHPHDPADADHQTYRLEDYLDQHGRTAREDTFPLDPFWDAAYHHTTHTNQAHLARSAHERLRYRIAERLANHAAKHGEPKAMHLLADRRYEAGDLAGAERWARQAAEHGESIALHALAERRHAAGDLAGAERCARQAAEHGESVAMGLLAEWRYAAGDLEGAERWAHRATEHGESVAMGLLAEWRYAAGDLEGAERWARRAAEHGQPQCMRSLAERRYKTGDLEGAERWARQAAEHGHVKAMQLLAEWRSAAGDLEGAERWARQAAEHGQLEAGNSPAPWESEPDPEKRLMLAAKDGHVLAMYLLVEQRLHDGDHAGAHTWLVRMVNRRYGVDVDSGDSPLEPLVQHGLQADGSLDDRRHADPPLTNT